MRNAVVVLIASGLVLSACGRESKSSSRGVVESTTSTTRKLAFTDHDAFMKSLWENPKTKPLYPVPSSDLFALAQGVCSKFGSGGTFQEMAQFTLSLTRGPSELAAYGILIGAAVRTLCPEHMSKLP